MMGKIYLGVITLLLVSICSKGQVTYTWVGGTAGDYQVAGNWTPARATFAANDILAFNAGSSIAVNNVPNQTIGALTIISGTGNVSLATNTSTNILTLSAPVPLVYTTAGSILSGDFLTIRLSNAAAFTLSTGTFGIALGTGGKIIINSALTVSGVKLDFDVIGTGGTTINGSITYNSGVFSSINTSSITWGPGSNYYHQANGSAPSAIPASIWQTGSTCNITGMNTGNIAPTGFGANVFFANLRWDCPSQFANVDLLPALSVVSINGTFSMASTGSKELRLSAAGKASVNAGIYSQTGGTLTLQANSDTTILNVGGSFSQSGGNLNGIGGTSPGTAIVDLKGNVTRSAGSWQSSGNNAGAQLIFRFTGSVGQTVDVTGGSWTDPVGGRCNIINSNTDLVNGINLTGVFRIYNTSSAQPATFTQNGIITGSGVVTYKGAGSGAHTLIYTGGFFQNASAIEYPALTGPSNLTINNSLGVSFPAAFSRSVPGTLTMLNGNLAVGLGNILSLTNPSLSTQLAYTAGFVTTGTLGRYFPVSGLPTTSGINTRFPFGSGANDRTLNVFFSSPNLTAGTAGMIYVTHTPAIAVTPVSLSDDAGAITLDKRSDTKWTIATSSFDLGSGGQTISVTAVGANIGSVDNYALLRLTDGVTPNFRATIPATGSNAIPIVGKSGLLQADLNSTYYIGSNIVNPLIVITFTWTGLGGNTNWTNPANWTGGVGYPSASTEIAIINSTSGTQPAINGGTSINVYQLTVGSGMTLTMAASAVLNVFDNVTYTGTANFNPSSTFGYSSSDGAQNILNLPYGNLTASGTGAKYFPATVIVTGNYNVSGYTPVIGTSTFIYAGTGAQRIAATNYYNLTITGSRANQTIALGNSVSNNTIDVNNAFDVSGLSNYNVNPVFNTFNFKSPNPQTIPGFYYAIISSANASRTLDPLGSADPAHVIHSRIFNRGTGIYTLTGSKVNIYVSGTSDITYLGQPYHDLTFSGDMKNYTFDVFNGATMSVAGAFEFKVTNFKLGTNVFTFFFNGAGDQVIPSFKTINATTPAFKFSNISIAAGNRNVTLAAADTIYLKGTLSTSSAFTASKGFNVAGSTVSYSVGSSTIPILTPSGAGTSNYNNIHINGGTHILGGNMTIGGNLSITGVDTLAGILNIGNGNTPRVLNVLGNMVASGAGAGSIVTGQFDMNTGTNGTTKVNLAGNLSISGNGQLIGTTSATNGNGTIVFNGNVPQTYTNSSSTFKNGLVNFTVGDGTTSSKLTLLSSINLVRSATIPNRGTLTVLPTDSLDCGIFNIGSNTTNGITGTAKFDLQSGATLITANTGGIEGLATNSSNGSILNDAALTASYSPAASYVLNAAGNTNTSFPSATTPFPLSNLTIGNNVNPATFSLNKSVDASNTLTLKNASTLALGSNYFNLKSTAAATARVAAVPGSANISYGTGRFVVERHYPARRAWRLVTAPITADTGKSVFSSWQMGRATTAGVGTYVSGPGANPAANGLDVSPLNNSSLKIGNLLTPVLNTRTQLISGTAGTTGIPDNFGIFIFVRGDRSNTNLFNPPFANATTLRDTGKIQIKTQTLTLTGPAATVSTGFELVGNPFPSQLDMGAVMATTTNINKDKFYLYDPYLNSSNGGYITMVLTGGVYIPTPASPGGLTSNIQSSQALYVQRSAGTSSTIIFSENDKTTSSTLGLFRPLSVPGSFRTNLHIMNADDSTYLADGIMARFDNDFSDTVDFQDALKFTNVNENISFLRTNRTLSVESRSAIEQDDTLFLRLTRTTKRRYQFEFVPANMDKLLSAFLEDRYTGTKTPVSLTSASTHNFLINGDTASAAPDRFRIIFKAGSTGPLAVTFTDIKAHQQGSDISVDWNVANEIDISKYEVEKSSDGVSFKVVHAVKPKGVSGTLTYRFVDITPASGTNFYRIKSTGNSGNIDYTRIVVVNTGKGAAGITIFPNPVTDNIIGISFNNMQKGAYGVRLINSFGQAITGKTINHQGASSTEAITPPGRLATGIYQLEVTSRGKITSISKVYVK